MLRWGLIAVFFGVLSGCGSTSAGPAEDELSVLEPSPPIVAMHEPAPDPTVNTMIFDLRLPSKPKEGWTAGESVCFGLSNAEPDSKPWNRECTAEDLERIERFFKEENDRIKPADDAPPRYVARLERHGDADVRLISWRNRDGAVCLSATWDEEESGPFGPCLPGRPDCPAICTQPLEPLEHKELVLAGTVPERAELIAIELRNGAILRYELVGPVIAGSSQRVFMVDLGARSYRSIELFQAGESIAKVTRSADELRWEDCVSRLGDEPTDAEEKAFDACLEKGADKPSE